MKNLYAEISPIKPDGSIETIRLCSKKAGSSTTINGGYQWLPFITEYPQTDTKFVNNGLLDTVQNSYGQISFNMSDLFDNEVWSTYDFSGVNASLWWGEAGDDFSNYMQIFEGAVSALSRERHKATLTLLGTEAVLDVNLLSDEYLGTGGSEGDAALKGTLKPWCSGNCLNIDPVLIDSVYWVYQVHGYGAVQSIAEVYEYAQALGAPAITVSTYAALIALALEPGQWAAAPAVGMFRLGGQPSQKISCDVEGAKDGSTYPASVSGIIQHIIKTANPSASFGDLSAFNAIDWCFYSTSQASAGEIARQAALEAGGYLFPNGLGVWQLGDFFAPKTPTRLSSERDALPLVVLQSITEAATGGSVYKVKVGHSRCWSTHSDSEISPAVADLASQQSAFESQLTEAQEELEQAIDDLSIASDRLDAMSADNKLDRSEKKYWIDEYARLFAEKTPLENEADLYSITTEKTDYVNSFAALDTYLAGLTPAWNDTTQDTAITRSGFRGAWITVYNTIVALRKAISANAATTANWSGVSGAGKPQDNATVGAPVGTYVGARPVADVLNDLEFNTDTVLEQTFRVDDMETVFDARTFVEGQPVGTVLIEEREQRETDISAINTTLNLIGAKSPDGTAFILDVATVQTGPGLTLSATLSELSSKTNDHEASIISLNEVLIDSDGVTAKAIQQINVDGHITGIVNTNDGSVGDYTIVADVFRIIDPNGGSPFSPFTYSDGVLRMTNVEVDTIKINSVSTNNLQTNSVTKKLFWQDSWSGIGSGSLGAASDDVWYDFGETGDKAHISFTNAADGGEVSVKMFINLQRTGGDNDRVWFRIMRSINSGTYVQVGDVAKAGMSNYPVIIHYEWVDTDLSAGNYDYKLQFYRDEGGGTYYSAKLIADLGRR